MRMQRWIREASDAEELANVEHTQSRPIVLRKKHEPYLLGAYPGEIWQLWGQTKNENIQVTLFVLLHFYI